MTTLRIIGSIVACLLMAYGSAEKPIQPPASFEVRRGQPDNLAATGLPPGPQVEPDATAVVPASEAAVVSYTDGPTPLTEAEFADLQKWLRDGKPLQEWVDKHPDQALIDIKQPSVAEQMLTEANRLGPYRTLDPTLTQAAQDYADYLARTRQQGHFADGDPESRAKRAGFTGSLRTPGKRLSNGETSYGLGEVLAFGHPDGDAAFRGWLASPGHKEALMEPTYDVAGFGQSGTIWVAMFGNSQAVASPPQVASKPQTVRYTQPQQSYSSCSGGSCGPSGFRPIRRIFRGRR